VTANQEREMNFLYHLVYDWNISIVYAQLLEVNLVVSVIFCGCICAFICVLLTCCLMQRHQPGIQSFRYCWSHVEFGHRV